MICKHCYDYQHSILLLLILIGSPWCTSATCSLHYTEHQLKNSVLCFLNKEKVRREPTVDSMLNIFVTETQSALVFPHTKVFSSSLLFHHRQSFLPSYLPFRPIIHLLCRLQKNFFHFLCQTTSMMYRRYKKVFSKDSFTHVKKFKCERPGNIKANFVSRILLINFLFFFTFSKLS